MRPACAVWAPTASTCTCCTGAAACRSSQTVEGFAALTEAGKIRHWGVSNLDLADMRELTALPGFCQTDQILYNLRARGPEHDLMPWLAERGIPVMAYSPVEQGRLLA